MKKKNYECNPIGIISIIILLFVLCGFEIGIDFLKNIGLISIGITKICNIVLVAFTDDGILYHIFGHPIVFSLVGILFGYICIKGKIGSIIGKIMYWLIGMIVACVLNFFNGQLFSL